MKSTQEVHALVWDFGTFISLAETMAEQMEKVWIYTPFEKEFLDARDCCKGDGLPRVERTDEPLDPDFLKTIDLVVFPDLHFAGHQRLLRSMGKAVWGAFGAGDLELYRTRFIDTLDKLGLPHVKSVTIRGLSKLSEHLKKTKNKWVKLNRFRENMETWHHIDFVHSQRMLQKLAVAFGPIADYVVFVVQDDIESDAEIGYDGWCVRGEFPESSFQGYEKKNELYLGSRLDYKELPEEVRAVNEAFSPVLADYGYQNFWATEIRKKGDKSYFIDPTARMPGQTGEQLMSTCKNLPDVMWKGANGELGKPDFVSQFAMEATLHYKDWEPGDWKTLVIPDEVSPWFKPYHYMMADGAYHFPPHRNDEVGVIIGQGDTIEDAWNHLNANLELLKDEPVCANTKEFADLLASVKSAEEQGMTFAPNEEIPEPELAIQNGE